MSGRHLEVMWMINEASILTTHSRKSESIAHGSILCGHHSTYTSTKVYEYGTEVMSMNHGHVKSGRAKLDVSKIQTVS